VADVGYGLADAAKSHIDWLEDIIRQRLPDVDFSAGPQVLKVDGGIDKGAGTGCEKASTSRDSAAVNSRSSLKRTNSTNGDDTLHSEKAASIATNLGMLSLNSDSSQKHHLGSSSGLLFKYRMGLILLPAAFASYLKPRTDLITVLP
jgi:hypothetical protein